MREDRFCREYVVDLNGGRAAERAGWHGDKKTLYARASVLLRREDITAKIQQYAAERLQQTEVRVDNTLAELTAIAYSDIGQLQDADGNWLPLHLMPPAARRAIAGIEIGIEMVWTPDPVTGISELKPREYVKKVKLWNKPQAVELALKYLRLIGQGEQPADPNAKEVPAFVFPGDIAGINVI